MASALEVRTAAVRRFNRFYTRQIGLLQQRFLQSPFSLSEARVLYELANHEQITAKQLSGELGLDAAYLSRILGGFSRRRLLARRESALDRRQTLLRLTARGKEAFAKLNAAQRNEVAALLERLTDEDQQRLVESMAAIEGLLGATPEQKVPYVLRTHQPGDLGWIVHRHGILYAREYGWDERFEGLVAEIVANFIKSFDPRRDRCWIAEVDGQNVGSVMVVRRSKTVAQLRLLLVEPKARGLGIGTRLVDECIRFARLAGYRKLILWTNDVLLAARRIYEKLGFKLVNEEPHQKFGQGLIAQTWALRL